MAQLHQHPFCFYFKKKCAKVEKGYIDPSRIQCQNVFNFECKKPDQPSFSSLYILNEYDNRAVRMFTGPTAKCQAYIDAYLAKLQPKVSALQAKYFDGLNQQKYEFSPYPHTGDLALVMVNYDRSAIGVSLVEQEKDHNADSCTCGTNKPGVRYVI